MIPEFAVEDCLRQNCSLGFSACSEGPAFGQNSLIIIIIIIIIIITIMQEWTTPA